jgi:hypothetical protein
MTTKLKLTGTRQHRPDLHLSDPIWTIKHIAKAFNVTEDRARRHTYRPGFPRPKEGFDTHSYCREAVLAWFRELDEIPATGAMMRRAREDAEATRPVAQPSAATPVSAASRVPPPAPAAKPSSNPTYRPRRGR